jgi:hypothetical protein
MDEHLSTLKSGLYSNAYGPGELKDESYKEIYDVLSELMGEPVPDNVVPLEWVAEKIYETDNSEALERIFCDPFGLDYDLDCFESEFEDGDWSEESEDHDEMEEEYGEEGSHIYKVYTKNKIHFFRVSAPFDDGVEYDYSEDRSDL